LKDHAKLREKMVEEQIIARGVLDPAVLKAMRDIPREKFVPPEIREFSYSDNPLPIGEGQTISQPYIVALMTEAMEISPGDRVLEIGTGSGYAAAVLSRIALEVYTVERIKRLVRIARNRLKKLGYTNVHVLHGNGTLGWPQQAPYNAIVVTACGPEIPQALLDQLTAGGRLIIPIGPIPGFQSLIRVRKVSEKDYEQEDLGDVSFVPLIGAAGWEEPKAEPSPLRSPHRASGDSNP
jgi:protein-L-isoaspartate(D-aspartate) O-methyltransferase